MVCASSPANRRPKGACQDGFHRMVADPEARQRKEPIALIVNTMEMGGVQRMTITLAAELVRRGFSVDLVLLGRTTTILHQVPKGVRIVQLRANRARLAIRRLRRYFVDERPSSILSAAWEANIVTMLASLGLRPRPTIVLSVRSTFSLALAGGSVARRAARAAIRLLYPLADYVAVISKGAAEDFRRHVRIDPAKVAVVYNPAMPDDFERLAAEPTTLFGPPAPETARIISVGRLTEAKDHATLIRAFAQVVRKRPAELILFGEGELRSELERLVAELGLNGAVKFAGMVQNPFPYMRQADLFVFSSRWEGFGNVLVEALAAGVPIVSADCAHGPAEILEGGKWGRLVPPGDADALAAAMLETLSDGGINGQERALDFVVEQVADLYLDLLGR